MKEFSSIKELPRLTKTGWELKMVPPKVFNIVEDIWDKLQLDTPQDEGIDIIKSKLFPLTNFPKESQKILDLLKPIYEEWCGQYLIPYMIYGVREYKNGSTLPIHTDPLSSYHISGTIQLDKDEIWGLNFQDHSGEVLEITQKYGGMLMYESAKCKHARLSPFKGNYFRNLYVHYKLRDWEYTGNN